MAAPTSAGSPLVNEAETKASESVPICPSTPKKHCKELEEKVFNDPIHGHIRLHPLLVKIIDTPQFQRLRYIKQLGGCYFVYPGASHNRFEHSIGVAHLAGKLIENIRREHANDHGINKVEIDNCDVLCVKIAGLCHDLGHGPFSHLWDKRFHKKKWEEKKWEQEEKYIMMKKEWEQKKESLEKEWEKKEVSKEDREHEEESLKNKWEQKVKKEFKWEHEEGSEKMLDYLIKENHLLGEYIDEENRLTEAHVVLIKRLINPDIDYTKKWPYPELENKSFLFEIVANKRNGVDVDKWDYFKRDCHHLGLTCVFDIDRAMQFIHVFQPDDQRWQICFRDKEARNIFQMFQTRELLHRQAYMHKTARVIERMLADAFVSADQSGFTIPTGEVDADGKAVHKKMSEFTDDPELYTNLTDHVFQQILTSSNKELEKAKGLLLKIQKRELYRFLEEIPIDEKLLPELSNAEALCENFIASTNGKLAGDNVYPDEVDFNFGKKEENPFHHIMFFSKRHNDGEKPKLKRVELTDVSSFLPEKFQEKVVRFYYKTTEKQVTFDEAKTWFDEWAKDYKKELQSKKDKLTHNPCTCTPEGKNGKGASPAGTPKSKRRLSYPGAAENIDPET